MISKEELKKLFENGDKPTQEEFWEWQDSYWHKGEKLPLETAGLYKIKGSVPDLTTLNYMSNMSEGDVYNVIETGDNYVYVLNLNNMGEAGWDKLGGLSDLSAINLQTVLDNGGVASGESGNSQFELDVNSRRFFSYQNDNDSSTATQIQQTPANIDFTFNDSVGESALLMNGERLQLYTSNAGYPVSVVLNSLNLLHYAEDYTARFGDRTLVDKGYVDSKINSIVTTGQITAFSNGHTGVINWTKIGRQIILAFDINLSGSGYSGFLGSFPPQLRPLTPSNYNITLLNGNNNSSAILYLRNGSGIQTQADGKTGTYSGVLEYTSFN